MTPICYQSRPIRISLAVVLMGAAGAHAHFQEFIPSTDIVNAETGNSVTLEMRFTHPMDGGPLMVMGEPVQVGVLTPGGREDLKSSLQAEEVEGKRTYRLDYKIKQPGDYVFYLEPAPYWEPAEEAMIVHYTKVVVDAFDAQEGWDADVGFPVEIEPLVRPYGLWAGNLFQGIVRQDGKAVPFAEVEVEWRNDGSVTPPSDPYITQVIKADGNGVFSYAMPRAGWWGFAALLQGDEPIKNPEGDTVPVELGALIWIYTREMR